MTAYDYDPVTAEYRGEITCQSSPLEPGVYLIPAHATLTAPPVADAGKARVWDTDNAAWTFVTDLRGTAVYLLADSRKTNLITALGGDVPDGYTMIAPPDATIKYTWDAESAAWTAEPLADPVMRYSKLKLVRALKTAGLWATIKTAIEEADAYDEWLVAQDLASDDTLFVALLTSISAANPDVDVDALLNDCRSE